MVWYGVAARPRRSCSRRCSALLLTWPPWASARCSRALTVAYRDFRYVVPFMVQLWMFATPCIYMPATGIESPRWHVGAAAEPGLRPDRQLPRRRPGRPVGPLLPWRLQPPSLSCCSSSAASTSAAWSAASPTSSNFACLRCTPSRSTPRRNGTGLGLANGRHVSRTLCHTSFQALCDRHGAAATYFTDQAVFTDRTARNHPADSGQASRRDRHAHPSLEHAAVRAMDVIMPATPSSTICRRRLSSRSFKAYTMPFRSWTKPHKLPWRPLFLRLPVQNVSAQPRVPGGCVGRAVHDLGGRRRPNYPAPRPEPVRLPPAARRRRCGRSR